MTPNIPRQVLVDVRSLVDLHRCLKARHQLNLRRFIRFQNPQSVRVFKKSLSSFNALDLQHQLLDHGIYVLIAVRWLKAYLSAWWRDMYAVDLYRSRPGCLVRPASMYIILYLLLTQTNTNPKSLTSHSISRLRSARHHLNCHVTQLLRPRPTSLRFNCSTVAFSLNRVSVETRAR